MALRRPTRSSRHESPSQELRERNVSETPATNPGAGESRETVGEIAKALATLDAEQLRHLSSLLVDLQRERSKGAETAGKSAGSGGSGRTRGLVRRGLAKLRELGVRSLEILRDQALWRDVFANAIPVLLGLLALPLIIQANFHTDRWAQKADLSVEYAFLTARVPPISSRASELIVEISRHPLYHVYVRERVANGLPFAPSAFGRTGPGLSARARKELHSDLTSFAEHLARSRVELERNRASLQTLGADALHTLAFRLGTQPAPDDSASREAVSRVLGQRLSQIDELAAAVVDLKTQVESPQAPAVMVRLTLLNSGATDGLVRHKGLVVYRGKQRRLLRVPPPAADFSSAAIPVFQTNPTDSDFAPQSIGKIERDSMTDFWYQFSLAPDEQVTPELCAPGESVRVTLFDQNLDEVSGVVACNEPNDEAEMGG